MSRGGKENNYKWFDIYPWLFSGLAVILTGIFEAVCRVNISASDGFQDLLTMVGTFVSVVIGLLGVLLTCLISIRDTSKLVSFFFENTKNIRFQKGMKQCILAGLLLILMTCILFIWQLFPKKIFILIKYSWVFLLIYFTALIYRFLSILISLVIDSGERQEGKKDNQVVTGERQAKMDEKMQKF